MLGDGCLIIDDVRVALASMTDLGRRLMSGSVEAIRAAVLTQALQRKFYLAPHGAYCEWASKIVAGEDCQWLVADPLFTFDGLGERVQQVRLSRQFDNGETLVARRYTLGDGADNIELRDLSGGVGLVDDAAATGNTLKSLGNLVTQAGGVVSRVVVCASSDAGRKRVRASFPNARWDQFARGDWNVIHLRDCCPGLPFTGRPTGVRDIRATNGTGISVRIPSSAVAGSYWQALSIEPGIRDAVLAAHLQLVQGLSDSLGRPARVADLCLMGADVPIWIGAGDDVTTETTLASLLPRPRGA